MAMPMNVLHDPPLTLEYIAIDRCRKNLVDCIAQSPDEVALRIKPLDTIISQQLDNNGKARSIVDYMQGFVQRDPQLFGAILKALEGAGPWTKKIVDELKQTLSSLQGSGNSGQMIQLVGQDPWPLSRGGFEQYTEKLSNPWPSGRGDPRRRKERIDLTPWSSSQAQASQYPLTIPGSLETLCTGEENQADLEPVNDFTPFSSSQAQASQYPLMTHGSPAIAGTLSSGARASAQSQSAGDVLTRNAPGTNVMHHQAQASRYPRIIPGSPAITGTLSSGASASPQYRSAVNVPLTNMMHHQAQASQYPLIIPGSLAIETVCTGEENQADEPVNDFTPFSSSQDQASQHPLMTPGSLSSGARASAQSQSAVDVPTRNVPRTNLMHHQVGGKRSTDVGPLMTAKHPKHATEIKTDQIGRKRTSDVDPPMTAKHPKLATKVHTDQTAASGSRSSESADFWRRFNKFC